MTFPDLPGSIDIFPSAGDDVNETEDLPLLQDSSSAKSNQPSGVDREEQMETSSGSVESSREHHSVLINGENVQTTGCIVLNANLESPLLDSQDNILGDSSLLVGLPGGTSIKSSSTKNSYSVKELNEDNSLLEDNSLPEDNTFHGTSGTIRMNDEDQNVLSLGRNSPDGNENQLFTENYVAQNLKDCVQDEKGEVKDRWSAVTGEHEVVVCENKSLGEIIDITDLGNNLRNEIEICAISELKLALTELQSKYDNMCKTTEAITTKN